MSALERLAQNALLCASAFVQDAATAALRTPDSWLDAKRDTYRERRDRLLAAADRWGLDPGYTPEGAYYLLVDVSDLPGDAVDVADRLLTDAGVATTPGPDFGGVAADRLRLSYATSADAIAEAERRVASVLPELRDEDA